MRGGIVTRLGDQRGFSIFEALLAATLMAIAATATYSLLAGASRGEAAAKRTEAAAQAARAALDDMKSLDYDELAMDASVDSTSIPPGEGNRFLSPGQFTAGEGTNQVTEDLVQPPSDAAGLVPHDPGATPVSYSTSGNAGIKFKVWKFVSWRNDYCTAEAGCSRTHDTKRLTVAVLPQYDSSGSSGQAGPRKIVWSSTIVTDPSLGQPDDGCASGPCAVTGSDPMKPFYLTDTPCSTGDNRQTQTDHFVHNTAANGSTANNSSFCWNNNQTAGINQSPDLMLLDSLPPTAPEGDPTPSKHWMAEDLKAAAPVRGYGPNGTPIMRTSGCASNKFGYDPTKPATIPAAPEGNIEADASRWGVHEWSTPEFNTPFNVQGLMSLDLSVGVFRGGMGLLPGSIRGTMCITLIDRDESGTPHQRRPVTDRVLYSYYCTVRPWPLGREKPGAQLPDGMMGFHMSGRRACRYNPGSGWPAGGQTIAKNHRLVFALSVCGANCVDAAGATFAPSGSDLVFFYDNDDFQTKIDIASTS